MQRSCLVCEVCFDMKAENHVYCSKQCKRSVEYSRNLEGQRARTQRFRAGKRATIIEIKSKAKCIKCGESHPACLQFHHRDPKEKSFTIAHAISHGGVGLPKLLEEIAKCDVVCANCHLKHHSENIVPWNIVRKGLSRGGINQDKMSR